MTAADDRRTIRELNAKRRQLKGLKPGNLPVEYAKVKRLSHSAIIELLLTRSTRGPSGGVTLTRNAKGETQIEVSVPTGDECPTILEASAKAMLIYDDLRERYPLTLNVTVEHTAANTALAQGEPKRPRAPRKA